MQTQTRRLKRIALLASRQEAEFVSGVLDAADMSYAIVEVDQGLELRVDPDDAERVQGLIERLDVRSKAEETTRQRRGEAAGRRLVVLALGAVLLVAAVGIATGLVVGPPGTIGMVAAGLVGAAGVGLLLLGAAIMRPRT